MSDTQKKSSVHLSSDNMVSKVCLQEVVNEEKQGLFFRHSKVDMRIL